MHVQSTGRGAVRVVVLIIVIVCISRQDLMEIAYKVLIVTLHGVWECMDSPLPSKTPFNPTKLLKIAKESLFELTKK